MTTVWATRPVGRRWGCAQAASPLVIFRYSPPRDALATVWRRAAAGLGAAQTGAAGVDRVGLAAKLYPLLFLYPLLLLASGPVA